MKTRSGFVSNSSTCSFLIYGVTFDSASELLGKMKTTDHIEQYKDKILEAMKGFDFEKSEAELAGMSAVDLLLYAIEEEGDYMFDELSYSAGDAISFVPGLSAEAYGEYDNYIYVGRSFSSLREDETPRQLKDGVKNALVEVFGEGADAGIEMHEGTYSC